MSSTTHKKKRPCVKVSLEVPHMWHSFIIGRAGHNINSVMKETCTKIHFPDQNRIAGHKKSNQVTVCGHADDVENARQRIRMLMPVECSVECRRDRVDVYGLSTMVRDFDFLHGVKVKEETVGPLTCHVGLRGSRHEINRLKEAVDHLQKRVNQTEPGLVTMKMEVSTECVEFVRANAGLAEQRSGASVDVHDAGVVSIRGCSRAVFDANQLVLDLLPVELVFTVPSHQFTLGVAERRFAQLCDLHVDVEAGRKPHNYVVTLSTYENNKDKVYSFYRRISRSPWLKGPAARTERPAAEPRLPPLRLTWRGLRPSNAAAAAAAAAPPREVQSLLRCLYGREAARSAPVLDDGGGAASAAATAAAPFSWSAALRFDSDSFRQLYRILQDADLGQYAVLFHDHEVDLSMFQTLTEPDLVSIGVTSVLARLQMLRLIRHLSA